MGKLPPQIQFGCSRALIRWALWFRERERERERDNGGEWLCSGRENQREINSHTLLFKIPSQIHCTHQGWFLQNRCSLDLQPLLWRWFSLWRLYFIWDNSRRGLHHSIENSGFHKDWLTSGRHETGEKWEFELYKSTNHIFLEGNEPLFLDSVMLEQGPTTSVAERMQGYQVIAMVILIGPKLKHVQNLVHDEVKKMMSEQFCGPAYTSRRSMEMKSEHSQSKPALIANCSPFGSKAVGMVVRIAAMKTQLVYDFLRHHLASMEPLLGASPYS
ncbi:urease accessory protein D isoform X2 [Tasmannia lanceolata]|uniref:urease accessory protein D isoform X2 n=1 Tax=Tasmannia lanceolata TaxID=3420 RepID=UPI0040638FE8